MKLKDLIKQINAIKKVHGDDLDCAIMNGVSGNFSTINSLNLFYPTDRDGCYDRSRLPIGIWVSDHKNS